jgi:hypothetical protein
MNANDNLERGIADVYHAEAPHRAPDWVLANALETIESTPQRRVLIRVPWRFPDMNNTFAKVAIAAVVVLAIGVVGLNLLRPSASSGVGAQPSASPSATPSPSPSPSPASSASQAMSTFTSTIHGLSIDYPADWLTDPATAPAKAPGLNFGSPDVDYLYDGVHQGDLFLAMASQPLAGKAPNAWVTDFLDSFDGGCTGPRVSIVVAGTTGILCASDLFATADSKRGYFVRSYTGSDLTSAEEAFYSEDWFRSVLATLQLHPDDARDTPVAASASPSS